jgi:outer membrane protein insertion porin family
MKRTIFNLLLTVGCLLSFVTGPLPAQTIIGIEAQARYADSLYVIKTAGLNKGDSLTRENLAAAIRRIFNTGQFAAVDADTFRVADGVRVRFRVREYSRLKARGLHFVGNHKVGTRELENKLAGKEKDILTDRALFDWTQKIRDLYKSKGFALVKDSAQLTPPDDNGLAEVNFFIEEGDQIKIKEIHIAGASAVKESDILAKLVNKPYLFILRSGKFDDQEFRRDLDRVVEVYKEKGYLDAKVLDWNPRYDQGWAYITINVSEGIKYYFGRLSFSGESLFTEAQLRPTLRMSPGAVYSLKKANQSLGDLYAQYSEQGYIYAQIAPIDSIHRDTVDIRYQIAENQPARVRLVSITGNDRTQEKVIRREIVSMPGSTFKRSEVIRSQQNIFNLGFFEDIQLDYKKVSDTSGDIDLTYKIKEKFPGSIGAGVSYSATEGIVGYVELTQPNLFGRAQQLHVKFEKGGKKQNLELGFTEPWLFDTPTAAGASMFYLTQTYDNYDKLDRAIEGNCSFRLPLDYTRAYYTAHVGDVKLSNIHGTTSMSAGDTFPKMTISNTFRLQRDSRDYIFNPSSGSFTYYELGLAGATVLGDVHFHKHILESNFFYPLGKKFALRFRGRFGYVSGFRDQDTIPPYERFYPGGTGQDGLRGYADRSLPNLTGYNPGGTTEAIFSLEYRFIISRGFTVLAFLDAGNAWPSVREVNLSQLKRGAGVGARLEIPMMGWLALDLGYGFDRPGTSKFEPHFQIGTGLPGNF